MVTTGPLHDPQRLAPAQRAALIYTQARAELASKLWNAALGEASGPDEPAQAVGSGASNLDTLLAALGALGAPAPTRGKVPVGMPFSAGSAGQAIGGGGIKGAPPSPFAASRAIPTGSPGLGAGIGPNRQYLPGLEAAAARTGLPATTIAAIIEAEAGKNGDGGWNAHSRNPRSSAAGLGQFLSGTWIDEAERKGSWLNQVASERGLLTASGKVAPGAKGQLLAMRYDPTASIEVTADFARANLKRMEQAGIQLEQSDKGLAHAAYLGHHLGVGDAIRFLKGGLPTARAQNLLSAQIGEAAARRRIAQIGDASAAHRDWLLGYVEKRVRPERFAG